MKQLPNIKLVIDALDVVEKPICMECRHLTIKTSMIMFTACELSNRMTMPVEAAKILSGNYCLDDCPILNERVLDLLQQNGTMKEAVMTTIISIPQEDQPSPELSDNTPTDTV